jgi:hypothetical protein
MNNAASSGPLTAIRALVATTVVALALLLNGIPMFMHPDSVYTGVRLHLTGALIQPNIINVDRGSPAYRAGLRTGDVISCLNVRDQNLLFQKDLFTTDPGYVPGTPIGLCVRKNGAWQSVAFVGDPRPPVVSLYYNDAGAALRLFEYSLFLLCALLLVLGRPGLMTWIFFYYAVAAAPTALLSANLTVLSPPLYALLSCGALLVTGNSAAALLLFSAVVPNDTPPPGWRTTAFRFAWIFPVSLTLISYFTVCQTKFILSLNWLLIVDSIVAVATVVVIVGRLAAMQGEQRARFGWAAFAILWVVIIDFLRSGYILPQSIGAHIAFATIVTPLILLYAILKRHVIDVRFVISRTLVYAMITTMVVGVIGAVDWATSAYLHEVRVAMALDALVTIGVAFALNRVHRWIESLVDFVLFRKKYEAETYLNRLARTLVNAAKQETVDRAIVDDPYRRLDLTMAALFRLTGTSFVICVSAGCDATTTAGFEHDHDLVRFLSTERTCLNVRDLTHGAELFHGETAQPVVAIPVFQGSELTAFVLYGLHRDGTKLDPDELEALERLCAAAAQAYTLIENVRYRSMLRPAPA